MPFTDCLNASRCTFPVAGVGTKWLHYPETCKKISWWVLVRLYNGRVGLMCVCVGGGGGGVPTPTILVFDRYFVSYHRPCSHYTCIRLPQDFSLCYWSDYIYHIVATSGAPSSCTPSKPDINNGTTTLDAALKEVRSFCEEIQSLRID